MKKKLLVLVLAVVMILSLGLSACRDVSKTQTATAYGMTHNQYAGQVTISVFREGKDYKVESIEIKEFLPINDIGILKPETEGYTIHGTTFSEEDIDFNDFVQNGNNFQAKRIQIGDEVFTYTEFPAMSNEGSVFAYQNDTYSDLTEYALYSEKAMRDKGLDIQNSYSNPEFTKWYIEKMSAGDYFVLKGEEDTYDVAFTDYSGNTTTKQTWADKAQNGYWPAAVKGLGWAENINKMETAIKTYGLEVYTGQEDMGEEGYLLGTNSTGATISDYHQYMAVAVSAYNQAKDMIIAAEDNN